MRESGLRQIFIVYVLLTLGSLVYLPPARALAETQVAGQVEGAGSGAAAAATAPGGAGDITTLEPAKEADVSSPSIFSRAMQGGWIVFCCLLLLVALSIVTWAVIIAKYVYLTRMQKTGDAFVKSFWDSRSLNDLNGRLAEYPYSPVREVFRSGYGELVRGNQLRESAVTSELAVSAALDNLHRALGKSKLFEKRRMEKFMTVLSISASASPFIGLFGTVWGIMGAFEGIAQTGSASLATVAPGIAEALISTAFGLAAAIPAVIGYNVFAARVRGQVAVIDGFVADFLNIVERYLVTDKHKGAAAGTPAHSSLTDRL